MVSQGVPEIVGENVLRKECRLEIQGLKGAADGIPKSDQEAGCYFEAYICREISRDKRRYFGDSRRWKSGVDGVEDENQCSVLHWSGNTSQFIPISGKNIPWIKVRLGMPSGEQFVPVQPGGRIRRLGYLV